MSKKSVIKRKRKPTIIVPVIIAVFVAYFFWQGAEKRAHDVVRPIQVPVAAESLAEHTEITKEHVKFMELPARAIPPNVILDPNELLEKYVATNYTISENSLFYADQVVEFEKIPSRISMMLDEESVGLTMRVNLEKSVANSLKDNMDVQVRFFTQRTPSGQAFEGVLEENIRILAVRDGTGTDLGGNIHEENNKVPTVVVFEATEEQASYLIRAQKLGELNILAISDKRENEENVEAANNEEVVVIDPNKEKSTTDEMKALLDELMKNEKDKEKQKQIEKLVTLVEKQKMDTTKHGERFEGNRVKLFIDAMSHMIEETFEDGYFITPKGEVVVFDEQLGELRYFESKERFMGSSYVLQKMTEEEVEEFFEYLEEGKNNQENSNQDTNNEENTNTNSVKNAKDGVSFKGQGNDETETFMLNSGNNIFDFKHNGQGNFEVDIVDESGKRTKVVDETGQYSGKKAIDVKNTGIFTFEVKASGSWEIKN